MRCLIVDDEEMAVKVIENHISQIDGLEVAGVYFNAMEAFSALQRERIDLLFLDIQMPKMSGLSLVKSLSYPLHVILTTAHREFALEGFELDVVDYLLKPISLDRFLKSVGKVFQLENRRIISTPTQPIESQLSASQSESSFFYIKHDRQYIKIQYEDVLYIESLRNHVKIFTTQGNYITLQGISMMENKLPSQHFTRIHRSFIISLSKVTRFSQTSLRVGDKTLTIGNSYREEVMNKLGVDLI